MHNRDTSDNKDHWKITQQRVSKLTMSVTLTILYLYIQTMFWWCWHTDLSRIAFKDESQWPVKHVWRHPGKQWDTHLTIVWHTARLLEVIVWCDISFDRKTLVIQSTLTSMGVHHQYSTSYCVALLFTAFWVNISAG